MERCYIAIYVKRGSNERITHLRKYSMITSYDNNSSKSLWIASNPNLQMRIKKKESAMSSISTKS